MERESPTNRLLLGRGISRWKSCVLDTVGLKTTKEAASGRLFDGTTKRPLGQGLPTELAACAVSGGQRVAKPVRIPEVAQGNAEGGRGDVVVLSKPIQR